MLDRSWLDASPEEAIEGDLEIVDAHHHLWESRLGAYTLDDLCVDTASGHRVVQTVFIDCGASYFETGPDHLRPIGETRYVARAATESERRPGATIAAIVGHADLTLGPAVAEVLEGHLVEAGDRFRGIRHSGARADDPAVPTSRVRPPPDLYRDETFQHGAATLAAMGLSFDAWQYHPQLDMVGDLARAVPDLTIVVNHLGGPIGVGRYAESPEDVRAELRGGLTRLARHDNVVLKIGGIGMTRFGAAWHHRDQPPTSQQLLGRWGDDIWFAIDTFGPSRCMFESNFPVDGETTPYVVLWNTFKRASAGYSPDERAELFAGTARRVYRIAEPDPT